jgi:hypothetical protein
LPDVDSELLVLLESSYELESHELAFVEFGSVDRFASLKLPSVSLYNLTIGISESNDMGGLPR